VDTQLTLAQVFLLGLGSTLHCLGMCGGIIGALSLSLPPAVRESRWRLLLYAVLYNLGRLGSYVLAGLLVGAFGVEVLQALGLEDAHQVLRYAAVIFMLAIGFYLAGWFPQLARVEHMGQPLWRRLQPIGRKLMPVNTPWRALVYGMVWGWLPCGMVYMVLLMTVTAGSAIQGGSMMLVFGLGTLPSMLSAGFMAGWIRRLAASVNYRRVIGIIIIVSALLSLLFTGDSGHHHHHQG
jgi:sulfite exporter TauE/SafE